MNRYQTELDLIANIPGYLTQDEAVGLIDAAVWAWHDNCMFFELGAFKGKSTVLIASVLKSRGGGILISVDPHEGELTYPDMSKNGVLSGKGRHTEGDTWEAFIKNITDAGVDEFVTPLICKSTDITHTGVIDFLFIDALHDEENVRADWNHFEDNLAQTSIIAWHDYGVWQGVTTVVDDLVERGIIKVFYKADSLIVTRYKGKE